MTLLLSLSACKKNDPAKADDKSGSAAVKPSNEPARAPEVKAAEHEARAIALMDKMLAAYTAGGDCSKAGAAVGQPCDCDKAAASITTFTKDNKAEIDELKSFERRHADVKQQFDTKHREKVDALAKAVDGALVESCKDNKAMQDVLKSIE